MNIKILRIRTDKQNEFFYNYYSKHLKKIISSGNYINGSETKRFEIEFSKYLRVKKTIGVANGTDAIYLCLKLMGIGKGDEVITTAFTAFPTIAAILMASAKPVFADIDYDTWLINKEKIMKKITKKTKAIIPVHFAGLPCQMDKILEISKKYKIHIIEDCAHSIESKFKKWLILQLRVI